jgi:hypothetical protein
VSLSSFFALHWTEGHCIGGAPTLLWNPASLIEGEWYSPRYSGLCVKHNEVGRDFIPNAIAAAMHNPQKVLLEALYLQRRKTANLLNNTSV